MSEMKRIMSGVAATLVVALALLTTYVLIRALDGLLAVL